DVWKASKDITCSEEDEDEEEGIPKRPQTQFLRGVAGAEPGWWLDGDWVKIIIKTVDISVSRARAGGIPESLGAH
ncbi:hypothetical protein Q8G50_34970, partial [Klebsiella pneumoniae]